jgi:hypothetical protein
MTFEDLTSRTMLEFNTPEGHAYIRTEVERHGEGWLLPSPMWEPGERGASYRALGKREFQMLKRKSTPCPRSAFWSYHR